VKVCNDLDIEANKKLRWDRMDRTNKVIEVKSLLAKGATKKSAAKEIGVPRTTLQYWLSREGKTGVSSTVEAFFETSDGLAFLHQLVIAAQFVMSKVGSCGTDLVGMFLEHSQLNQFVAGSHGHLHNMSVNMEEAILNFGEQENTDLSANMPKKKISICQDETFHPDICLVAMEPVSNFILLEKYDKKRDAKTWLSAMSSALKSMPVDIIQSTSDEAKALIKYVEQELGVHHSPDLFHVQQELTRATTAPLQSKLKQAEAVYQASLKAKERLILTHAHYAETNKAPCSWSELNDEMNRAVAEIDATKKQHDEVQTYQVDVKKAKKALGDVYHPYDLNTGLAQTAEEVGNKLEANFLIIQNAAEKTWLSENSMKRLDKAHRVFKGMTNTLIFFWTMVQQQIMSLSLSPKMNCVMQDILIPGFYLQIAAKKARNAADRHRIKKLSLEILARLEMLDDWCHLAQPQRDKMKRIALECAQLFQRSSSCVEGRNGYLALRHHSSHNLSDRKLRTLTIIHNYFIRRPDGTTAAERFFEKKPRDVFRYLLDNLALPARPAKRRKEIFMAA